MFDRIKILEALAFWRTRISAEQLGKILGLKRQVAQEHVIQKLRLENPNAFVFERRRNGLPDGNTTFDPVRIDPEIGNLFHLAIAVREFGKQSAEKTRYGHKTILGFPIEEVKIPESDDVMALQRMTAAAVHRRAIIGTYTFKNSGLYRIRFSPHSMVKTPYRIHFRGFLEIYKEDRPWITVGYRDLIPSRFIELEEIYEEASLPGMDDDWITDVELCFQINPDLPPDVRYSIATEYDLTATDDEYYAMKVIERKAYSHYFVNEVFSRTWGTDRIPIWIQIHTNEESNNHAKAL